MAETQVATVSSLYSSVVMFVNLLLLVDSKCLTFYNVFDLESNYTCF